MIVNAAITFHLKQANDTSHDYHSVRAVITIIDKYNDEEVTTAGGYDPFHQGLLPGEEKNAQWIAGWIFNQNINGYYNFYYGCNVDGHQYIEPTSFPMIYIADKTDVDVTVMCPLTPEGYPTEPKIEIIQKAQS